MKRKSNPLLVSALAILCAFAADTPLPAQASPQTPQYRWFDPAPPLPELTLTDAQTGFSQKFHEWRQNRPVVIATWASWARLIADPGILQGLQPVMNAHPETDVRVLILRFSDLDPSHVREDLSRLATHPMPFPVLSTTRKEFKVNAIPTFTFISRNGTISYHEIGFERKGNDPLAGNLERFIQNEKN
jgi:hypothetical protein